MKFLRNTIIFFLLLVVSFAIYISTRPSDFNFNRSKVFKAPASVVFNKVNDFKNWPEFSPWLEKDPKALISYGTTTKGKGGSYACQGSILGEGHMITEDAKKHKEILQTINFTKPFEASSQITWRFKSIEQGTKVTWQMEGKQDFMSKVYTLFMGSIEETTTPDFDRGLIKLDSIIKRDMAKHSISIDGVVEHSGGYYLYKTASCRFEEINSKMQDMMSEIGAYAVGHNIGFAGKPFVLYHKWDRTNNAIIFATCIPTTTKLIASEADILTGQLPPFKAIKSTLTGDHRYLMNAWQEHHNYIKEQQLSIESMGPMIEIYTKGPRHTDHPAQWVTELYTAIN